MDTSTARTHNIDAEEVMGMLSAALIRAPSTQISFISAKIRAQKNKTLSFLDALPEDEVEKIVKKATKLGHQVQQHCRSQQSKLLVELSKRQAMKQASKDTADRNKLGKELSSLSGAALNEKLEEMGLDDDQQNIVVRLLSGQCVGLSAVHKYSEEGVDVLYQARIEKYKPRQAVGICCCVLEPPGGLHIRRCHG